MDSFWWGLNLETLHKHANVWGVWSVENYQSNVDPETPNINMQNLFRGLFTIHNLSDIPLISYFNLWAALYKCPFVSDSFVLLFAK